MSVCMRPFLPLSPGGSLPPRAATRPAARTTEGQCWVSAAGGLAGGGIHAAAHCGSAAQAAGGALEGLHAAVPLDAQMLQLPALPALPKLHLDLPREEEGATGAIMQTNCSQNGPIITLVEKRKKSTMLYYET